MFQKYNIAVNTYSASQMVEIVENCNSYTATNLGDSTCTVGGMVLFPGTIGSIIGDSRTVGGNAGEVISERRLPISFTGGTTNNLEVIQKYYIV